MSEDKAALTVTRNYENLLFGFKGTSDGKVK